MSLASGLLLILLNAVADKQYIERLQLVIRQLHGANSTHVESIPVLEQFNCRAVWDADVEVFTLTNHPKAQQAYVWSAGEGAEEQFTAVLGVPPVLSPQAPVKAAVVAHIKKEMK